MIALPHFHSGHGTLTPCSTFFAVMHIFLKFDRKLLFIAIEEVLLWRKFLVKATGRRIAQSGCFFDYFVTSS